MRILSNVSDKMSDKVSKISKNDDGSNSFSPTVKNSFTDENSKGNFEQNTEELKGSSVKQFKVSQIPKKSFKEVCGNENNFQYMTKQRKGIARNEIDKKLSEKEIRV